MGARTMRTGDALKQTSRETGLATFAAVLLIGRYCDRHGITLTTEDTLASAGGLTSLVMYGATHLRASRIARLADAVGDRLEYAIRQGINLPSDPSDPGRPE